MPNLDLPILVVDDAKFSSVMVGRTLKNAGYRDVRFASSASDGLKVLEERPVSVLIADWLMPEMDGLELAERVRQIDEQTDHYTYVILLTAKEGVEALAEAFDRGVDDFIYKSDMNKQLLPRVFAADRISDRQNTLLMSNRLLIDNNRDLEVHSVIDLETGLGNLRHARETLQRAIDYTESRGGATSLLLLGIRNWQHLRSRFNHAVMGEVAMGIGRRLTHLIRPLDTLCRVAENQFAIIQHFNDVDHCSSAVFRRIHEGINLKAFKTSAGFVSVDAGTSICGSVAEEPKPKPEEIERVALEGLLRSYDTRMTTFTLLAEARKRREL